MYYLVTGSVAVAALAVAGRMHRAKRGLERQREDLRALLAAERRRSDELDELVAVKGDVAAMVAHELGSPLAAIRGFSDMLGTGDLTEGEQARALAMIEAETALLSALMADLDAAASVDGSTFPVRPQPVDIGGLLADVVEFARALPGEHPVEAAIDPDLTALADPERIAQVVRNLITNATKYSDPGTPITLNARRDGSAVEVEVCDRGIGIHPDDSERIFEKYVRGRDQLTRPSAGAGLGLYLARRMVRAHGSDLTVQPRPGGGSIFRFTLDAT